MKRDDINVSMFAALKVSEKSGVPTLFMSNPGVGKSTSVELFAKVRGYHLQLLRGNATSAEEALGYDVADVSIDSKTTKHLRPSWFTKVLEKSEQGVKTLLFLDEITTANENVQSALLHLIFDRSCGDEKLPEDTLIVAAGNYAQNLSNSMVLLPPLMNRFMIYNVVPVREDLSTFLSKFTGNIAGKPVNKFDTLKDQMNKIDQQEREIDEVTYGKIGEFIEKSVKLTADMLIKSGKLDLSVKDLQGIYSNTSGVSELDSKLLGFVSFRTLNYLRDVAIANYLCFGKDGMFSSSFHNMIDGLVGLGISKDKKKTYSEPTVNYLTPEFIKSLEATAGELDKLNNTRLPIYEKYFNDTVGSIKSSGKLDIPELNALFNKIEELKRDSDMTDVVRPISDENVEALYKELINSLKKTISQKISEQDSVIKAIGVDPIIKYITVWNLTVKLANSMSELITTKSRGYGENSLQVVKSSHKLIANTGFRIHSFRSLLAVEDPTTEQILPEINPIKEYK